MVCLEDRIMELKTIVEENEAEIRELKEIIWKLQVGEELTEEEAEIVREIEEMFWREKI